MASISFIETMRFQRKHLTTGGRRDFVKGVAAVLERQKERQILEGYLSTCICSYRSRRSSFTGCSCGVGVGRLRADHRTMPPVKRMGACACPWSGMKAKQALELRTIGYRDEFQLTNPLLERRRARWTGMGWTGYCGLSAE